MGDEKAQSLESLDTAIVKKAWVSQKFHIVLARFIPITYVVRLHLYRLLRVKSTVLLRKKLSENTCVR